MIVTPFLVAVLAGLLALATVGAVWLPIGSVGGLKQPARNLGLLALVCLLAWGGKLFLIDRFGTSLPFWDQWIAEGWNLYRPFLRGELAAADLFVPHNEHRILTTRILDLALLLANGQWDGRLQMAVNALVHVGALLSVCVVLWHAAGRRHTTLFTTTGLGLAVIPFAWSNTLGGFQVQFYFLLLFSVATITVVVNPRGWWAIPLALVFGLAACFSMASGLLAAAACLPVLAHSLLTAADRERGMAAVSAAACVVILATGFWFLPASAGQESLHARDVFSFAGSFGHALSWPFPWAFAGLLIWWPWLAGACRRVSSRQVLTASEKILLALGCWVILQAAAMAYARGGEGYRPPSRYLDMLLIGLVVNLAALCRWPLSVGNRFSGAGIMSAWTALMLAVLLPGALGNLLTDCVRLAGQYAGQARATREFLATGDPARLRGQSSLGIPFWDADVLIGYLQDPTIRSILPPPFSDPLVDLSRHEAEAVRFGVNDYDPFDVPFSKVPAVGTYSHRLAGERHWRSKSLPASNARWLHWELAGYPTKGFRLTIEQEGGAAIAGRFLENPKQQWRPFLTSAPAAVWSLSLSEPAGDHWVAVRGPWALGTLSGWLQQLLAGLDYLLFGTAFLLLFLLGGKKPGHASEP